MWTILYHRHNKIYTDNCSAGQTLLQTLSGMTNKITQNTALPMSPGNPAVNPNTNMIYVADTSRGVGRQRWLVEWYEYVHDHAYLNDW